MITETQLFEALPVAVYMTDAEGRITFYNRAAAELWGHNPELSSGQWCGSWRLYWPDGRPMPHNECPMATALKEGREVRGVEAIAERPDGTRLRFRTYPTLLRDASGRIVGAVNLLMDATEQHDAHLESEWLAAIVVSSNDAIISKTLDGVITSWNGGAARIFGYEPSEMIGQSILRLIPPELHGEESEILARLQRGERIDHYETVRVAKDGRRVDVSLTVSPLRDRSGKVVGASKVGRDITERKRAEKLQRILTDELSHRVRNTLATVQEIATNARKYGALSVPDGRLSVTWEMRTNGGCSLHFAWKESDGPKVSAPRGHGFGRALIEQTVQSHGGHVSVHYHRDGLTCEIDLPLPAQPRALIDQDTAPVRSTAKPSLLSAADHRRTLEGKRVLVIEEEPIGSMA